MDSDYMFLFRNSDNDAPYIEIELQPLCEMTPSLQKEPVVQYTNETTCNQSTNNKIIKTTVKQCCEIIIIMLVIFIIILLLMWIIFVMNHKLN